MRILGAGVHGVLDLVAVGLFLLGPLAVGLGGSPAAISYCLAAFILVMSLLTRYPLGVRKVIPFVAHGIVELVLAVFLLLLPSIGGYGPGSPARRFYTIMGGALIVVWALTSYKGPADEVAPDRPTARLP